MSKLAIESKSSIYPTISIVIPAFNEAKSIGHSINIIMEIMHSIGVSFEIVIVDDGSTDSMWDKLIEIVENNNHLRAIKLSRNFGKESALCAGMEHARGNAIIVMDADMQHPPSMLPQMIKIWQEGKAEIVECVKKNRGNEPLFNKLSARLFYGLLSGLAGYDLRGASDFKLLDRKVVTAWGSLGEKNVFFRGMTQWLGFSKVQLEFDVANRIDGISRWSFIRLIKLAVGAIIAFTSLPLRLVSIFGALFLIGAIFLGGQTLIRKIIGEAVTGFTTVILLQLFIGSIIMVSLGIIGEYIASIYKEIKGRPRYLISNSLEKKNE